MHRVLATSRPFACALAIIAFGSAVAAPAPNPAAMVISQFDDTLLSVMQSAKRLGYDGRYRLLAPAIERTFDVASMTRIVVGSSWQGLSDAQRNQLIDSFRKFIVSTYAKRFDGYSGESFALDDTRTTPLGAVVDTHLVRPNDAPIQINYLMRADAIGHYKAVDVFLTGTISELATRRSEFGAVIKRDGIDGLIAALAQKSDVPAAD